MNARRSLFDAARASTRRSAWRTVVWSRLKCRPRRGSGQAVIVLTVHIASWRAATIGADRSSPRNCPHGNAGMRRTQQPPAKAGGLRFTD